MFGQVFKFEFKYQITSRLMIFAAVGFFLLSFLGVISDNVQFGALGGANLNSPYAILQMHLVWTIISMVLTAIFAANVALRDFDNRTAEMIFSTRVTRSAFLLGRAGGALAAIFVGFLAVSAGTMVGGLWPTLDQELIGPFTLAPYLHSFFVYVIPNLTIEFAVFFAIATLTRNNLLTYVGVIGFIALFAVAQVLTTEPELRLFASLIDPFGTTAVGEATRYWTVFERNSVLLPIAGAVLYNRLLWLGISIALLAATFAFFHFDLRSKRRKRRKLAALESAAKLRLSPQLTLPRVARAKNGAWGQLAARTRFEVMGVLKSIPFAVLVLLAVTISMSAFLDLGQIFGAPVYPVTRSLIQIMSGTVTLWLMIVMTYYGAEIVWRDRDVRFHEILGATPTPSWAFVSAKIIAVILVCAILLLFAMAGAIVFQLAKGFDELELGVYLSGLLYSYGGQFYLAAVLSVVLQIVLNNKYVGMLLMVVYIVSLLALFNMGFEDPLYLFAASSSPAVYSDMNGWGGLLAARSFYFLYWGFFALFLSAAAYVFWTRGPAESFRARLRAFRGNLTRGPAIAGAVGLAGFVVTGGFIFYNTHILNNFVTQDDLNQKAADYESIYSEFEHLPQPRIIDANLKVDLYPDDKRFEARATYQLKNETDKPISEVRVGFAWQEKMGSVELEGAELTSQDPHFNYYVFTLDQPMQPGDVRNLNYELSRTDRGFKHARNIPGLLAGGGVFDNGSFVGSNALGPYIAYDSGLELTDRSDRRKLGLPELERFAPLEDKEERRNSYLRQDSDWIDLEVTVSTAANQIAVAPGYLQREWTDGDRHYFDYKMDAPIQNLFAIFSARYAMARENWNGVEISVYYYPRHTYNVARMIDAVKKSIAYYSKNFSPYQYRQMRVLEFPAYANFAVSFPNTVGWSEGLGFVADLTDPEKIDYVFYVGAHELAHQWWGHQVSSANVQGQTVLVETLAQYSALMVMEHEYGPDLMRRFLKYELDNYLSNRGQEALAEMPLERVENQQYIHYRKGSMVMYAMKDYLGEDAVNRALANLIAEKAYQDNPYPTSLDLVRLLRAEAKTDAQQQLITDLFERITLFDLKVDSVSVTPTDDGRFHVVMEADAAMYEADGAGKETEIPLDMPIDIGLFAKSPADEDFSEDTVIQMGKERVTSGKNRFEFTVDRAPTYAGIDPYNKLIDRNSDDNLMATGSRLALK